MISAVIAGVDLRFETAPGLFSPERVDRGTVALLEAVRIGPQDKVLDLGCGYGVMGVFAATQTAPDRVWMVDRDSSAIACAERNARLNGVEGVHVALSDGFRALQESGFDKILCNPPFHTDFAVARHFIEKGFNRLAIGGAMWMVTRRDAWYRNKFSSIFGGVRVAETGGYFVFEAVRRRADYANRGQRARRPLG